MATRIEMQLAQLGPDAPLVTWDLKASQRYCQKFARSHYENFVVASLLLPVEFRQDFYTIYSYCRWADDLADEIESPAESLRLLDWWEQQLMRCREEAEHPVFQALGDVLRRRNIPLSPFADLLNAFRQDQTVTSYAAFEDLLSYCRRSANPVGRILLALVDADSEDNRADSDAVCTGLQLINHWQDVARDFARGRVYLPQESLRRFAVSIESFPMQKGTTEFRRLLEFEVERAESYLVAGRSLLQRVPPWFAADVELFVEGGLAVANAIRRQEFDVWIRRPRIRAWRKAWMLIRAWRRPAPSRSSDHLAPKPSQPKGAS